MSQSMMKLCKECAESETDYKSRYCGLTGKNCRRYPTDGDCVNFETKKDAANE